MAPDLLTLGLIRHEDTVHIVKSRLSSLPTLLPSDLDSKSTQVQVTEIPSDPESNGSMGNANDARKRSLASMYGTSFVFNQNQKNLVRSLPWSKNANSSATKQIHNPVPTSEDMQRMVTKMVQGSGNGRKLAGEQQIRSLQSEKLRSEHASSMFALLV